jgi:hypothetical protein
MRTAAYCLALAASVVAPLGRFVVRAVPGKGLSLLVPTNYAHGLWLEFLQLQ